MYIALFCLILCAFSSARADLATTQEHVANTLVSPSSRYQLHDAFNMYLNAEFLWWVAQEDGLYYAQSGTGSSTAVPPNGNVNFDGHMQRIEPNWNPGFRAGFGGNMPYDEWDIFLYWTFYHTHPTEHKNGNLLVLWGHPDNDTANIASHAKASWLLTMNLLDLELGRWFWIGRHLSIRPFLGGRATWVSQNFKVKYDYLTSPETQLKVKSNSDFQGGGVRAGVNSQFNLLKGWSIYGLASTSLLYGHFDTDFHEKENAMQIARAEDSFHHGIATIQLGAGLRWDVCVHRDRYHIGVYAGWEQNLWFGINKMNHYQYQLHQGIIDSNSGDLSLQGGTLGMVFDF